MEVKQLAKPYVQVRVGGGHKVISSMSRADIR